MFVIIVEIVKSTCILKKRVLLFSYKMNRFKNKKVREISIILKNNELIFLYSGEGGRKMKKFVVFVLMVCMTVVLSACGSGGSANEGGTQRQRTKRIKRP